MFLSNDNGEGGALIGKAAFICQRVRRNIIGTQWERAAPEMRHTGLLEVSNFNVKQHFPRQNDLEGSLSHFG